jgi:hypothetical protein
VTGCVVFWFLDENARKDSNYVLIHFNCIPEPVYDKKKFKKQKSSPTNLPNRLQNRE